MMRFLRQRILPISVGCAARRIAVTMRFVPQHILRTVQLEHRRFLFAFDDELRHGLGFF